MVRRHHAIYEYSSHARCIFRINHARAEHSMLLRDGTHICRGDPIIKLHLWNEHMPSMGDRGPSVAWGRNLSRAVDISLEELARYLHGRTELNEVKAICADMCLGTAAKRRQLARIVGHFGFEAARRGVGRAGPLERIAQNIMMFLLVLATNPSTLRGAILLRTHQRIFLSREALLHRYIERQDPPLQGRLALEGELPTHSSQAAQAAAGAGRSPPWHAAPPAGAADTPTAGPETA
jgi:hypothetical protein